MTRGTYDTDELRALAVALDVLDPEDPDEWGADADALSTSVARGRAQLERRGLATFARDGAAEVDPEDAGMLRAFLAPDAVIEAWMVDGSVAARREWYVGPELAVVTDPAANADERELSTINACEVFADVIAFLDIRGVDIVGEPVRIDSDAIDGFAARSTREQEVSQPAPRLINVTAAWMRSPSPRDVQLLDAGPGGLWLVAVVERDDEDDSVHQEVIDLIPATWGAVVERLLTALSGDPKHGRQP